eukprot:scaffold27984_cov113-Isochrysis_galbana.AAC.2
MAGRSDAAALSLGSPSSSTPFSRKTLYSSDVRKKTRGPTNAASRAERKKGVRATVKLIEDSAKSEKSSTTTDMSECRKHDGPSSAAATRAQAKKVLAQLVLLLEHERPQHARQGDEEREDDDEADQVAGEVEEGVVLIGRHGEGHRPDGGQIGQRERRVALDDGGVDRDL